MNPKIIRTIAILIMAVILSASWGAGHAQTPNPSGATALIGSAFTYQGRLSDQGNPTNGAFDLRFILYDAAYGGAQVGSPVALEDVPVSDGYFSVSLDFGAGAFDGQARWLEIAVRPGSSSGEYILLSPRQALSAAPYAISLRLPFIAETSLGGPLAWFENDGTGEAAGFSSLQSHALWIDMAGLDGVYVNSATQEGVHVITAGGHGLAVETAGNDGVHITTAGDDGVHINSTAGDGLYVYSATGNGAVLGNAGADGVAVGAAGDDGFQVFLAGSPSDSVPSNDHNGFEVAGAQGYGLYVGRADFDGMFVNSAGFNGISVGSAGGTGVIVGSTVNSGFLVDSAGAYGVSVGSAGMTGLGVGSAGWNGVTVNSAGYDGVYVGSAGNPSAATIDDLKNGFEVAGAQGHGLYVGRADADGVRVNSAHDTGIYIVQSDWNGLVVDAADGDGVRASGTVYNALYGDTANALGEWGLYTPDKIHAQNVTLQTLTLIAQVCSPQALYPGDVVAAAGVGEALPGNQLPFPLVQRANAGDSALGVVEARLVLTDVSLPEGVDSPVRNPELRSAEGPASPGDYVALTVFGVAQVRIDLAESAVQPGTRLTSGATGYARPLKTVIVDGVTLAEGAASFGIALSAPDEHGFAWVLVNPQ